MSSIDERIVEMRFDKKQFQTNVESTIKTLDDFERKLQLTGASKGLDNVQATANKFSLDNISNAVSSIADKFSLLGAIGFSAIQKLTQSAMSLGANLVSQVLDPIVEGGMKRALNLEQARFMFKGLGMDIESTMKIANDAVSGTAYSLDEAAKAAAQFGASQVDMGTMAVALKAISGVAAMAGDSYGGMADVFTKVAGQGRLMGDDLLRLSSRGINAAATLAKALGTTEANVRDMVTKGQIDFATFSNAMNDAFGEHATKANETYTGSLANMRTALARIGAAVQEPRLEYMRDIFNSITPVINNVKAALEPLFGVLKNIMSVSSKDLVRFFDSIDLTGFEMAMGPIAKGLENIFNFFRSIRVIAADAFSQIFPPVTMQTIGKLVTMFLDFTETLRFSSQSATDFKKTLAGFFAVLDIGWMIVKEIVNVLGRLITTIFKGSDSVLSLTGSVGDALVAFRNFLKDTNAISTAFDILGNIILAPVLGIQWIISYIKELVNAFKSLDFSKFEGLGGVVDWLRGRFEQFAPLFSWIGDAVDTVKTKFMEMFGVLKGGSGAGSGANMKPILQSVLDFISGIGNAINDFFKNITFDGVADAVNAGLVGAISLAIIGVIKSIRKQIDGGLGGVLNQFIGIIKGSFAGEGSLIDGIKNTFGALTSQLETMQTNLKAKTLLTIASAIGILALSAIALSLVDSQKLGLALGAITVMMIQLGVLMAVISKKLDAIQPQKMAATAGSIMLLAVAIGMLTISVLLLSLIPMDRMITSLVALSVMLVGITFAAEQLSSAKINPARLAGASLAIGLLSGSLLIMSASLLILSTIPADRMVSSLLAMTAMIIGVIYAAQSMAAVKVDPVKLLAAAAVVKTIAGAVLALSIAVKMLAELDTNQLISGLVGVGALLAGILLFLEFANLDVKSIKSIGPILAVSAALLILSLAVKNMSSMGMETMLTSLAGIGLGLGLMVGAIAALPTERMLANSAALILVSVAVAILVQALMPLTQLSWDSIGPGLVMLGVSLAILAGAMALMGIPLVMAGAIGMLAVAAAMTLLVPALIQLSSLSWDQMGTGFGILAAGLGILAGMGLLLIPASVGFLLFGAALLLIGSGIALASIGVTGLAVGLGLLAVAGAGGAVAFRLFAEQLIGLIPMVVQKVGEGLILLAGVIANSGPQIVAAIVTVLTSLIEAIATVAPLIVTTLVDVLLMLAAAIVEVIPPVVEALVVLITALVEAIVVLVPLFIDAGLKIITGVLEGIGANIGQLIDAGVKVITEFLDGIGRNAQKIVEAGIQMIVDVMTGIAQGIRNKSKEISNAAADIGEALIDGIVIGIGNFMYRIWNKITNLGNEMVSRAMKAIGAASPAKRLIPVGEYFDDGLALGIDRNAETVYDSATDVGKTAISKVKDSLAKMGDIVSDDMHLSPTITPVLDLSAVKKSSGQLNTMFGAPTLSLDATANRASSIAVQERQNEMQLRINETEAVSNIDKSVTFVQNNNSPKALSEAELYRQTKNQISVAKRKGALTE